MASAKAPSSIPKSARLSQAERDLLMKNQGCFKCRKPFMKHHANACPNGQPKSKDIVPIMEAYIESLRPSQGSVAQAESQPQEVPEAPAPISA